MISKETAIILPLHPSTREIIKPLKIKATNSNLKIIDPVSYLEMVFLLEKCDTIMTDSGGLQKEAFFFKKPCITLREETEWVELVEYGFNYLARAVTENIYTAFEKISKVNYDFCNRCHRAAT